MFIFKPRKLHWVPLKCQSRRSVSLPLVAPTKTVHREKHKLSCRVCCCSSAKPSLVTNTARGWKTHNYLGPAGELSVLQECHHQHQVANITQSQLCNLIR